MTLVSLLMWTGCTLFFDTEIPVHPTTASGDGTAPGQETGGDLPTDLDEDVARLDSVDSRDLDEYLSLTSLEEVTPDPVLCNETAQLSGVVWAPDGLESVRFEYTHEGAYQDVVFVAELPPGQTGEVEFVAEADLSVQGFEGEWRFRLADLQGSDDGIRHYSRGDPSLPSFLGESAFSLSCDNTTTPELISIGEFQPGGPSSPAAVCGGSVTVSATVFDERPGYAWAELRLVNLEDGVLFTAHNTTPQTAGQAEITFSTVVPARHPSTVLRLEEMDLMDNGGLYQFYFAEEPLPQSLADIELTITCVDSDDDPPVFLSIGDFAEGLGSEENPASCGELVTITVTVSDEESDLQFMGLSLNLPTGGPGMWIVSSGSQSSPANFELSSNLPPDAPSGRYEFVLLRVVDSSNNLLQIDTGDAIPAQLQELELFVDCL